MFGKKKKKAGYSVQTEGGKEQDVVEFFGTDEGGPAAHTRGRFGRNLVYLPNGKEGDPHAGTKLKKKS